MSKRKLTFAAKTREIMMEDKFYWYGIAAAVYIVTCWVFSVVRAVHNCGTPKERRDYIWPDRKMQVAVYLTATVLLPYVLNPKDEAAWILFKSYFPGAYYFYCGALIFCFFGTVKQWKMWKTTNLIAAAVTCLAMLPLVLHAWWPSGLLTPNGVKVCNVIVLVTSCLAMIYAGVAMWQVRQWMKVSRDVNYSNPEDFPTEYAHRMWIQTVMAWMCVPLAIFNIALLLNVMPVWRRAAILNGIEDIEMENEMDAPAELAEERTNRIAAEIEQFLNTEAAYLDPHLKLEQVVERCSFSRKYVIKVFIDRFGGFADYVNGLRIAYFERYRAQHPNSTEEAAAEASGFTSLKAYAKAKERLR